MIKKTIRSAQIVVGRSPGLAMQILISELRWSPAKAVRWVKTTRSLMGISRALRHREESRRCIMEDSQFLSASKTRESLFVEVGEMDVALVVCSDETPFRVMAEAAASITLRDSVLAEAASTRGMHCGQWK